MIRRSRKLQAARTVVSTRGTLVLQDVDTSSSRQEPHLSSRQDNVRQRVFSPLLSPHSPWCLELCVQPAGPSCYYVERVSKTSHPSRSLAVALPVGLVMNCVNVSSLGAA